MTHEIKCLPKYFNALVDGLKNFEVRKNDRDYKVGDSLLIREYDNVKKSYTDYELYAPVTYILKNDEGFTGLSEGFVVLGLDVNVLNSQREYLKRKRDELAFLESLDDAFEDDDPFGNIASGHLAS